MTRSATPAPRDLSLEALRGSAALLVAVTHLFYLDILLPGAPLPPWLRHVEAGHTAVLLFFVLSGYVIAWTNPGDCSRPALAGYVRRRTMRLGPIYACAIGLTLLAAFTSPYWPGDGIRTLWAAILVQNYNDYFGVLLAPPIVNGPLWSLHYEILFYAAFPLLWIYRPRLIIVFGPALLICTLGWFCNAWFPRFVASYATGWICWASGWWLIQQPLCSPRAASLLPSLLLVFAHHQLEPVRRILNGLDLHAQDAGMINLADLGLLIVALHSISRLVGRTLPFARIFALYMWVTPAIVVALLIFTGRFNQNPMWWVGAGAYLTALATLGLPAISLLTRAFAWLGGISYAFYVVHFPLLYLVSLLPVPASPSLGFVLRALVWAALALGMAVLLETQFQPWVHRLWRGKSPVTP